MSAFLFFLAGSVAGAIGLQAFRCWLIESAAEPVDVQTPPAPERVVFGSLEKVDVYVANLPSWRYTIGGIPEWHGWQFHSCAQAFEECPGAEVIKREVYRCGDDYFAAQPTSIDVRPKADPKGGK